MPVAKINRCSSAPARIDSFRVWSTATRYQAPKVLLDVSEDLQGAMRGLAVSALHVGQMLQTRGW
jgi:pyridoxal biosynthesis lyase PdxS